MALRVNIASSVYGLQIIVITTGGAPVYLVGLSCLVTRRTEEANDSRKHGLINGLLLRRTQSSVLSIRQNQLCQPSLGILCSMNLASSQSDDHDKLSLSLILDKARTMWDSSPRPIKSFPWNKAFDNFIQLNLNLFFSVIKYLSIPLFAISSSSEMSYCAHERKLLLVPLTLLIGYVVAGVLRDTALESSPYLKTHHAAVPWHLISTLIFFVLLKCPGPYYPYWTRIIIPHLANGVLVRTFWFMFQWYWRPQKSLEPIPPDSTIASPGPNSAQ